MCDRISPRFRNVSPLLHDLMKKLLDRNPNTYTQIAINFILSRLGCGPEGIYLYS